MRTDEDEQLLKILLVETLQHYLDERDPGSIGNRLYMRLFFNEEITNEKKKKIQSLKNYVENTFNAMPFFVLLYDAYHTKFTTKDGKKIRYGSNGDCGMALCICMEKIISLCDPNLEKLNNYINEHKKTVRFDPKMLNFAKKLRDDLNNQKDFSL